MSQSVRSDNVPAGEAEAAGENDMMSGGAASQVLMEERLNGEQQTRSF